MAGVWDWGGALGCSWPSLTFLKPLMRSRTTENLETISPRSWEGTWALLRIGYHLGEAEDMAFGETSLVSRTAMVCDWLAMYDTLTEVCHLSGDYAHETCQDSQMAHAIFWLREIKENFLSYIPRLQPSESPQISPNKRTQKSKISPISFWSQGICHFLFNVCYTFNINLHCFCPLLDRNILVTIHSFIYFNLETTQLES